MLNQDEIIINRFAQEKLDFEKVLTWFENLNLEEQAIAISKAKLFLEQTHPSNETIERGIESVPLKPTMTPIILLKTKGFKVALNKIVSLPKDENKKVFITLISIFKVADTIRRNIWCKEGCDHEWHNLF